MNAVTERTGMGPSTGFVGSFQHRLARQFQVQVDDWLDTCRDLAAWEDRFLVELRSPERLAEHASMLDELERLGHWLAGAAGQVAADPGPTSEQLRLALQDLRDSRAMWHGDVPLARKTEILRDCFNES